MTDAPAAPPARLRVLYLSHATPAVYAILCEALSQACDLVTLDQDSDAERRARIADCDAVIAAATPLTRSVIEAAPRLRLVHHQGVGYHDTVDLEALRARGIRLALTPSGTTTGVAEFAVLLMLAVARRLAFADAELRAGRWHVNSLRPQSRELAGRTIGYVGMGRIGQAVAERLKAFGTTGLYHDERPVLTPEREAALGLRRASLDAVLAGADIVTLHVPLTPATRHLIDARALVQMKPGAMLVNTARGPIVDEAALHDALVSGRLGGAGLDVFEVEPLPATSPLAKLPNVVLTPHISAGTRDALREKMAAVAANLQRFARGETMENEVDLSR